MVIRTFCRGWGLPLALVAAGALGGDRTRVVARTILLSEHPATSTHPIYVAGQVTTVIRFKQPVDPARTKMTGWEGRLEPLAVVGSKVILEPLHDLGPGERIPLVVRLADGTAEGSEVSFLIETPPGFGDLLDQQVNVYFKGDVHCEAAVWAVQQYVNTNRALEEENKRLRAEERSADHMLAALLASGSPQARTLFRKHQRWSFKEADSEVDVKIYAGEGKAAAVFQIKNLDPGQAWQMSEIRSFSITTGEARAVAMKFDRTEPIAAGESGRLAIVADRSAFLENGGLGAIAVEIYRQDGLMQARVALDPAKLWREVRKKGARRDVQR